MRGKPYATAREFRVSANAHMKKIAGNSGRPTQEVNREFVLQRFLARVFQLPDARWVLKGGTGLLVSIDLSVKKRPVGEVDWVRPTPIVELPGIPDLPEFALYPLADQSADKVCAMYEKRRDGTSSTRYHDLVDLVLIVTSSTGLDAARTTFALQAEATHRDLALPSKLTSPGGQWPAGYRKAAGLAGLSEELHDLGQALGVAGACLDPLLGGESAGGIWDATERRWQ